ncbi:MAG: hypothetical protein LBH41_02420 [Rickettsiales bacterium]|jgi:hypothetical protein|nr:hypothetical protein [Rickettsiales bacterium]
MWIRKIGASFIVLALAACGAAEGTTISNGGGGYTPPKYPGPGAGSAALPDLITNEDIISLNFDIPAEEVVNYGVGVGGKRDSSNYVMNSYNEAVAVKYDFSMNDGGVDKDFTRYYQADDFVADSFGYKRTERFVFDGSVTTDPAPNVKIKFDNQKGLLDATTGTNTESLDSLDVTMYLAGPLVKKNDKPVGLYYANFGYWKKAVNPANTTLFTTYEPFSGGYEGIRLNDLELSQVSGTVRFKGNAVGGANKTDNAGRILALPKDLYGQSEIELQTGGRQSLQLNFSDSGFYTFNWNGSAWSISGTSGGEYAGLAGGNATFDTSNNNPVSMQYYGRRHTPEEVVGTAFIKMDCQSAACGGGIGTPRSYYINAAFGGKRL